MGIGIISFSMPPSLKEQGAEKPPPDASERARRQRCFERKTVLRTRFATEANSRQTAACSLSNKFIVLSWFLCCFIVLSMYVDFVCSFYLCNISNNDRSSRIPDVNWQKGIRHPTEPAEPNRLIFELRNRNESNRTGSFPNRGVVAGSFGSRAESFGQGVWGPRHEGWAPMAIIRAAPQVHPNRCIPKGRCAREERHQK